MKNFLFFLLSIQAIGAEVKTIQLGTFSLATEAGWGAAFKLKKNGKATITPRFDGENAEGKYVGPPKGKDIAGTWKQTKDGIEIAYLDRKDELRFEKVCQDWFEYPCFRYNKSLTPAKGNCELNFDYPYINWDWKNQPTRATRVKK